MKTGIKLCCLLLTLCLLFSIAACTRVATSAETETEPEKTGTSQRPGIKIPTPEPVEPPRSAKNYKEVKAQLLSAVQSSDAKAAVGGASVFNGFDAVEEAAVEAPATPASDNAADYSETNVQVEGVDEADIVKTDGTNIYSLTGSVVQIIRADGADTALLSEIYLGSDDENTNIEPLELYVKSNRLYVLANKNTQISEWQWADRTELYCYDISDPEKPTRSTTVGLDGYYQTSRLTDGRLYLISLHYLYEEPDEGEDWVPCTYKNGEAAILPAEGFYLCPDCQDTAFTMVGIFDCDSETLSDVCSFTGCCDSVYMSKDNLYIAQSTQEELTSEPYTEDQYTVTDHRSVSVTRIHRISTKDGKLTPTASGSVNGTLLNQFSMDEYNGMLRLAVTSYSYSYKLYKDEKHGFENFDANEETMNNSVLVLDSDMNLLGSSENLVEDERIYSVRFMGETAYVVTYKSIDPVFTLDLSDPTKPTVQSALEVLGVSDYLQSYGEGLLFGFGEALDENAASQGLQLSMFDTSDPKDVKLLAKTVIENFGSEALYNHKALIVNPEKNLIMFPGGNGMYYVYSYENGTFAEKGSFELGTQDGSQFWYWERSRGLYIGEYLYLLCDQVVFAVDMNNYETVSVLSLAEG